MEGKLYCQLHYQQSIRRQRRQPVPDHLKLERARRTQKLEPDSDLPPKRIKQEDPISPPMVKIGAPSALKIVIDFYQEV
ncbi:hypothetical protein L1987_68184 [Smallanthus sonchifolius]|uniref:Uncharacterized protein n=1 Tax=Smallanthus sonchifolius TaxID=185202 RepID=A0ACB9B3F6_9ASTR|nr:hypothetical protein L1987_68184 [Smallanthus sonchifolius]